MTKREWKKWVTDNAVILGRSGLTARQAAILAKAYASSRSGNAGGRLYLPIALPDGVPVAYDGEEVRDLENRGLIRREISESGARSITITECGIEKLIEIFGSLNLDADP